MPEGKIIPYAPGEYPELDSLKEGTKVSFEGQATVVKNGDQMGLQINDMNLDPDNDATRELKTMTGQDNSGAATASNGSSSSGF